jgi:hypothetical protein
MVDYFNYIKMAEYINYIKMQKYKGCDDRTILQLMRNLSKSKSDKDTHLHKTVYTQYGSFTLNEQNKADDTMLSTIIPNNNRTVALKDVSINDIGRITDTLNSN